MEEETKGDI